MVIVLAFHSGAKLISGSSGKLVSEIIFTTNCLRIGSNRISNKYTMVHHHMLRKRRYRKGLVLYRSFGNSVIYEPERLFSYGDVVNNKCT